MATESDLALAKVLLDRGTVRSEILTDCLNELARLPDPPSLGDLLVSRGHLTPEHLRDTIRQETPKSRGTKIRQTPQPPEVAMAPPGARFGKYVRVAKLGSGGMGEVWKAWDTELGRWVALKFLKGEDEEEIARFKQEAQLAGKLSHPNIAAIYDVGQDRDRHYIAMQFVDGPSLRSFPRGDQRRIARILRDAARGVHYAHSQGVVHRDLKPENLMITTRSEGEDHAYVMDFGLARTTQGASNLSVSGFVVGTPAYMPPEQAFGRKADARADVYSLGATLYELLSGRPPFEGPTVLDILKKVTEEDAPVLDGELGTIAAKAMEKDRERRYASAGEFAADLDHWLSGEPILARRASVLYRARKRIAKRKALIAALAAGIGLALGLTAYFVPKVRKAQRFAAAYDGAMIHVNEFGLAAATMSERRHALAAEAVRALETATAIDDRRPMAWVWLGRCRRALGQESASCWQRALAIEPTHAEALLERSGQQFEAYRTSRGEAQAGYASYRKLVTYQPLRPETAEEAALRSAGEADLQTARTAGLRGHLAAYLEAMSAFGREDYAAAERLLGEYLEQAAWDATARLVRARAFRYQRRYPEAEKDCRRVLEFQEKNGEARRLLGLLYRDQHRPEDALRELLAARELAPENLHGYYSLSSVYTDLNRFDEAERTATAALNVDGKYTLGYLARGWANHSRGRYDLAEADYTKAIELEPRNGRYWNRRGFLRQQQKRYAEALADYDRGLLTEDTDPTVWSNRGNVLQVFKRYPEALASYDKAIAIDDQLWAAHLERSILLAKMGRGDDAEASMSRAFELKPGDLLATRSRALMRFRTGRWAGSIEDWRKVFELEPTRDRDYPHLWIWVMRSRIGEREAATAELRDYVSKRPRKRDDEWYLWICRYLTGGIPRDEFLRGAATTDPQGERERKCEAYYYAGVVLLVDGDPAGARGLFEKCLATEITTFVEYEGAEGELRRMKNKE